MEDSDQIVKMLFQIINKEKEVKLPQEIEKVEMQDIDKNELYTMVMF